jgi:hypothetical protein
MDTDLQALYDAATSPGDRCLILGEQRGRDRDAVLDDWRSEDALHRTEIASLMRRQAVAAEATAALVQSQTDSLMSRRGEAWMALYRYHLEARKTALSTSTTDATLVDIVRDAVLMTNEALRGLDAAGV